MSTSDNTDEIQPELRYTTCRSFPLAEIQLATNNFHDSLLIGSGGFGKVYVGFIDNGVTGVAIKRLNPDSNQGSHEFWTEVRTLSDLRHTHLVALIGYCNDLEEMILVYEFIPNGSLADHLHNNSRDTVSLTWDQRVDICIGAARGLDYLHTGTRNNQGFIHRDVKTTNILLDQNWVAKVSDFGLSKAVTSYSQTHMTTAVKGTFGYLDPDYYITQRITKKSDVYAFGVVMLEVLSGRPAVNVRLEEDRISLVFWAKHCIDKGWLYDIVDPVLKQHVSPQSLKCFLKVATQCLHDRPQGRPTMAEIVVALEQLLSGSKQEGRVELGQLRPKEKKKKGLSLSWLKRLTTIEQSFRDSLPNSVEFHIPMPWVKPPPTDNLSASAPDGRNASSSQRIFTVRRG